MEQEPRRPARAGTSAARLHRMEPPLVVHPDGTFAVSVRDARLAVLDVRAAEVEVVELEHPGRLVSVEGDVFAVLGEATGCPLTVRSFERPRDALVRAQVVDDALVPVEGDPGHLGLLPPLMVLDLRRALLRVDVRHRVRHLRDPLPEWATDLETVPYASASPDGRHVLVCAYRHGAELLAWDAGTGRIDARVTLLPPGVTCGAFRPGSSELWIAQHDTIERIDMVTWQVAEASRVRDQPTGSFVHAMAFSPHGERVAVAHSLRRPQPLPGGIQLPWYAPSGGEVLVIDADRLHVTHALGVDGWLDALAWLADGRLIARGWGGRLGLKVLEPQPARRDLYPPRPPGSRDWI